MDIDFYNVVRKCSLAEVSDCSGRLTEASSLKREDLQLLKIRAVVGEVFCVCEKHKTNFLDFFTYRQTKCCDPLEQHSKPVGGVKEVSMQMYFQSLRCANLKSVLIPGTKLCKRCVTAVTSLLQNIEGNEPEPEPGSSGSSQNNPSQPDYLQQMLHEAGGSIRNVIMPDIPKASCSAVSDLEAQEGLKRQDESIDLFAEFDAADQGHSNSQSSQVEPEGNKNSQADQPNTQGSNSDITSAVAVNATQPDSKKNAEAVQTNSQGGSSITSQVGGNSSLEDPTYAPSPRDAALTKVNSVLQVIRLSPVRKRKLTSTTYLPQKLRKIGEKFEELLIEAGGSAPPLTLEEEFYGKTMAALKHKFEASKDTTSKVAVLSVALSSLSFRNVLEEFAPVGATDSMVKKTMQLLTQQGVIMPTPLPKRGRTIPTVVVDSIKLFYELDDVSSRLMPGMKDYVTVTRNGVKCHEQKRLVLCTLKELYKMYKEKYPDTKVGFSKFASLRPKHCVLAGASGTHSVCVCKYHENCKLMLEAGNFKQYEGLDMAHTYHDIISFVTCDPPTPKCFLEGCCSECPGFDTLKLLMKAAFEENFVDTVTFQQWSSTDRCNLNTLVKGIDEFLDCLFDQLKALLPHNYIAKEQSKYLKKLKEELEEGEVVVVCDFAENYTTIIQDSVQSYYWDSTQVTLHPFVAYYKSTGVIECISFVVVSDYMKHGVAAVYAFQAELITFLKGKLENLKKVYYFSDGAAQQYKNRNNVINIRYHMEDFGIECEWHFFATSHGKGPCDGLAGALKRCAYLASLRKYLIRNAFEFYTWAKKNMSNINVVYVSENEVLQYQDKLKERFDSALEIPEIRSQHAVLSVAEGEVMIKRFSQSTEGHVAPVKLIRKILDFDDVVPEMFITVLVEGNLCLGQVQFTDPDTQEVLVNYFKRVGRTYKWKATIEMDDQTVSAEEILVTVAPTLEGGFYSLSPNDVVRVKWQTNSIKKGKDGS